VVHDDVDLCGEGTPRVIGDVMQDATEEPARELARMRRLDARRTELVALLGHDMRDRLTVVGALAEILRLRWDDLSNDEKLENLEGIRRNSRTLTRLLDESQHALTDPEALLQTGPAEIAAEIRARAASHD
jgi:signal transduction histidine kinase